MKTLAPALVALFLVSCQNSPKPSSETSAPEASSSGYVDGVYCAEVDYYYSKTGKQSTYTLNVDIKDSQLTVMHWPNGGWLDDSHFEPVDITHGAAHFTSDKGMEYTVRITGNGACDFDQAP